jgi:glycosyltransferase involved in cell wall biosynthesis
VIRAAGVVIPAHNEEQMLPTCLRAVRRAAAAVSVPVHVLVVADACSDRTTQVAQAAGAALLSVDVRNVGSARAAGVDGVLRQFAPVGTGAVWLGTTDADTLVPPEWLIRQLTYADAGWDVVLGTVRVAHWREHSARVPAIFAERYAFRDALHPHVHGANFGIRASAYLAAGGFRALRCGEDHALRDAAIAAGHRVLPAGDLEVMTSGRRQARAPGGFGDLLRSLGENATGPPQAEPRADPRPATAT